MKEAVLKKGICQKCGCTWTTPCVDEKWGSCWWMNWGTMWNGKSLTARILEYPKTENGCSLSDILEENVPEEFFLSQKVASKLIQSKSSTAIPLQPDMATHKEQGRTLLKVNRRK